MCEEPRHGDDRARFVIEAYQVYWANMSRSMEGVWKILAPITVAGTAIAAVHQEYLPASLGVSLVFLVCFWALNVVIDLNAWHKRNLLFATKAERQFLAPSDYGALLPARYRKPKLGWITFYKINAAALVALLALTSSYAIVSHPVTWGNCCLPALALVVGIACTVWNYRVQARSEDKHFNELFVGVDNGDSLREERA